MRSLLRRLWFCAMLFVWPALSWSAPNGYYRQPALHRDTLVFVAEGDLWTVSATGGVAHRLTSHPGEESNPAISPDGQTLAFIGHYEGPAEVYTMPLAGGLPTRRTFDGAAPLVCGWSMDGKILCSTDIHATLPARELMLLDVSRDQSAKRTVLPLAQASDGCFDETGKILFFTRLPFQGSHTKRYQGGTAQNLWRFAEGDAEATPLTKDYPGTSKCPMFWSGRVYFASDRDGTMNIWSMKPDGSDLKQHTKHAGWDVASSSLSFGRIVYQLGADLYLYDIISGQDHRIRITLDSDLDQMREHWIKRPMDYATSTHISPDGDRVAITARGQVFVIPQKQGRLVEASRKDATRYRDARFLPDGKSILALCDKSGEVEFWKLPANGVGENQQLTNDGQVLRWEGVCSPDGKLLAHHDKNQRLFVLDLATKKNAKIDEGKFDDIQNLAWSPDSRYLAYVVLGENELHQIRLYDLTTKKITNLTTERYDSYSPAWSADGKWLYLLSDRNLVSVVGSPWGAYQPEPFLDKKTKLYMIALSASTTRSPFAPKDELQTEAKDEGKKEAESRPATQPSTQPTEAKKDSKPSAVKVNIDFAGIQSRLMEVPVAAGNYNELTANDKALFFLSSGRGEGKRALVAFPITNDSPELKTVAADVGSYEMSPNGKKLLVRRAGALHIVDAAAAPFDLEKTAVDLSRWRLSIIPRDEWRQMFVEAWRLERDYFYDRNMHGTDWKALRKKYEPLVERVTTRAELSDLIAQMVSELSALHIFVRGGDVRSGDDDVYPSSLGAQLVRDEAKGGYRIQHIYQSDPDEPSRRSPLSAPAVNAKEGDVIETVNGTPSLSSPDIGMLLRHQAGQQVLLRLKSAGGAARDVIVVPLAPASAADLRYHEWEYTRRQSVDQLGKGQIGYVHLRAMGGDNFTEWAKGYYPVSKRPGLIIDMRHNRGGNIDSWILNRLLRKAWFFWTQRVGQHPAWNMHYAYRGHIVVLCDQFTASDGEAFTEGIKRLKLGTVIGTRTWGGEIWLSSSNILVDRGIATAAEFGVYGPEGQWLIEGHGVEPDIVVDNLPHATFEGEDAQLKAAVAHLQKLIREQPVQTPPPPKYPDKSR